MEEFSYVMTAAAFAIVIIGWIIFAAAFLLREKTAHTKDVVNAPRSWLGIGVQLFAYLPVWALQRRPMFSPFVDSLYVLNIGFQITAAAIGVGSVFLTILALRELGKQWSLEARLVEHHDLVTTGPYSLVRHPIYTGMLGMLIANGIVLSHWLVLPFAVVVFLIGTSIRTRFEEGLLRNAFGEKFNEWRSRVPGLVPFVKL